MNRFLTLTAKDLRIRFTSPVTLVFFLVLPLVFTIVLSGGASAGRGTPPRDALILVQDLSKTAASTAFVARLSGMPGVRIRQVIDPTDLLRSSEPDLLISLDKGGAAGLTVRFRLSPWKPAGSTAGRVRTWLESGTAAAPAAASAAPTAAPAAQDAETATFSSAAATSNAGQIITWVLVPLLGIGSNFISERRRGTMRRILATPTSSATTIAATAAAEVLAALVQIGLLVAFGAVAFHLPWLSHPAELIALSVAFCVGGASLGALLGLFARTERQAGSLGIAVAMVLAVLGGCWYPAVLFPAGLRAVTALDPAGWAMDGFLAVLSPAASAAGAWKSAALLLCFSAAVLLLTLGASRVRRVSLA